MRPLSAVDKVSFTNLMKVAEPRYTVPARSTVTNRLKKNFEALTSKLVTLLLAVQFCAITHDSWTSIATQSFCAVTMHLFTKDWQLKSLCLATKELPTKHTAKNLAASLREAQRRWKFKTPIAVSDNAANEIKTFQLLKWTRLSCFGHNLNLAVKACFQVEEISAIIFKCRKVV